MEKLHIHANTIEKKQKREESDQINPLTRSW